jgi:hypothetical protein
MVFLTIEDVGAWADKNGGETALREGLAVGRFWADRRTMELVETWLKLKDQEYVEAILATHIIAELSAMAAEKTTKWTRVNRRISELTETWLKLKAQGHDEAKQTDAFNAAERSAVAAAKAAKWTFWAVAAACGTAIILMQALIPLCENGRQAFMEPSGNQAKLDVSLTQNIDTGRARRALAAALIRFSEETGSKIITEGVETTLQFEVLRQRGCSVLLGHRGSSL